MGSGVTSSGMTNNRLFNGADDHTCHVCLQATQVSCARACAGAEERKCR